MGLGGDREEKDCVRKNGEGCGDVRAKRGRIGRRRMGIGGLGVEEWREDRAREDGGRDMAEKDGG